MLPRTYNIVYIISPTTTRPCTPIYLRVEELEKRDEFIQGVQRNYQTLSALCAKNIKTIADLTSSLKQSKIELEEWKTNANAYMDAHQRVKIIEGKNTELLNKHTEYESELKGLNNKCYEYQIHIADLNDIKEDLTNQLHRTQQ